MRSASLLVLQKSLKSSAYRTMKTFFKPVALNALYRSDGPLYCLWDWNVSHWLDIHQSNSFRTTLANNGLRIPPCGTPFSGIPTPAMGAFSILDTPMQISMHSHWRLRIVFPMPLRKLQSWAIPLITWRCPAVPPADV